MDREGLQTNERERETNETNTAAGKIFGWRKRRLRDNDDDGGVWDSLGANCQLCATFSQIKADSPDGRRRREREAVFSWRGRREECLSSLHLFLLPETATTNPAGQAVQQWSLPSTTTGSAARCRVAEEMGDFRQTIKRGVECWIEGKAKAKTLGQTFPLLLSLSPVSPFKLGPNATDAPQRNDEMTSLSLIRFHSRGLRRRRGRGRRSKCGHQRKGRRADEEE